uniref:Indole-3-glycerol phosphate synthase n=1 Tax=Ignisphaera aggregans TaxID=334771 RepID=A0A7J3YTM1_9CREN
MSANLVDWINRVIEHNLRRPAIRMERLRPLYSLSKNIEMLNAAGKPAIIAEYKRKSPSGLSSNISLHDYINIVKWSATGVSILTEELFFGGSYKDLVSAASMLSLPILMKDFIVCEKQVETAYSIGADAILLISTILTEKELEKLYEYAKSLGLEVIIEVHEESDLEKALTLEPRIIGVNSRNLKTLEVSIDKASRMLEKVPRKCIKIAESGIKSLKDIQELMKRGANAFLIGTTLITNPLKIFELTGDLNYPHSKYFVSFIQIKSF